LRRYFLAVTLLLVVSLFVLSSVSCKSNSVTGTISADKPIIIVNEAVTLTCTYVSTQENIKGRGALEMSGPYPASSGPFTSWNQINAWNTLTSNVPVTFNQSLTQVGYYQFRWLCSGGGIDGAYTVVTVQVVDTVEVLPEGPPIGMSVMGLAAFGVFALVIRRKTKAR
jgi:hypothetical protein